MGFELYVVTWFLRIRFFYLTLKIRARNLKNSCRRNGPLLDKTNFWMNDFITVIWLPISCQKIFMKRKMIQKCELLSYQSILFVIGNVFALSNNTWGIVIPNKEQMVFCYQNCSDQLWEKIVLVIEKNFWNSQPSASNLQNFWDC